MFTSEDRNSFVKTFDENLAQSINSNALINEDLHALAKNVDELIHYTRSTVKNAVLTALPVGVPNPNPLVRTTSSELRDGSSSVSIVISSAKSSPVKYRYKKVFAGESLKPSDVVEFFARAIRQAVILLMVNDNLVPVNAFLEQARSEVNLPFSVGFIAPGTDVTSKFVTFISNDELEFVVSEDVAFDRIPNLRLFDDSGTTEEGRQAVRRAKGLAEALPEGSVDVEPTAEDEHRVAVELIMLDELAGLTTPVELLNAKSDLFRILAGITTHTPTTMIRGSEKRKIAGVTPSIKRDVTAVVETADAIGIVTRVDGKWTIQLDAVNKSTYEPSDFDLIAAAESITS